MVAAGIGPSTQWCDGHRCGYLHIADERMSGLRIRRKTMRGPSGVGGAGGRGRAAGVRLHLHFHLYQDACFDRNRDRRAAAHPGREPARYSGRGPAQVAHRGRRPPAAVRRAGPRPLRPVLPRRGRAGRAQRGPAGSDQPEAAVDPGQRPEHGGGQRLHLQRKLAGPGSAHRRQPGPDQLAGRGSARPPSDPSPPAGPGSIPSCARSHPRCTCSWPTSAAARAGWCTASIPAPRRRSARRSSSTCSTRWATPWPRARSAGTSR